eukprot:CAMPEP_0201544160 /NCGR_PEP_ID=MMETSP0173_2-20130828/706_1 /ASSEMBLY_ACC=CAM_ASM_000268 /TAXON_ID=218659 /ORGANISM="Vexillifera sp., Strain DIVA3 564/2" /LENGTH=379 /DNA_ID=CAMNT_0047952191 /DNA_START=27 /DNA_END=1166 /DNA_ORIENTATION=+
MTDLENNFTDGNLLHRLNHGLDLGSGENDPYIACYVWIGGTGLDLRCKSRTLYKPVTKAEELPVWNYDGSSTGQAPGHDSEVHLYPRAIFKDPFRRGRNILVMCDCYKKDGKTPVKGNYRKDAVEIFNKDLDQKPWYGIEQEFTLFNIDGRPYGFPKTGTAAPQGPYYCGVGVENSFGRDLIEAHYRHCLYAGIKVSGINAEVMIGQWEYQVGPCEGISIGDEMWMSRFILQRLGEQFRVRVSFDPKPMAGDWNGAGCHTNYSTEKMRQPGGMKEILSAVEKLGKRHKEHILVYGEGNDRRLTGKHETASIDDFTYGVGNRGASIRIPTQCEADGCGYLEDRRPASNIDPYLVASKIFETTVLWDGQSDDSAASSSSTN